MPHGNSRLLRQHTVAERADLRRMRHAKVWVGDPPGGQAHHPLDERGTQPRLSPGAGLGGRGCRSAEHLLPAPDRRFVVSPCVRERGEAWPWVSVVIAMAAQGSVRRPSESFRLETPLVPSLAQGVGNRRSDERVRCPVGCVVWVGAYARVWGGWHSTSPSRTCWPRSRRSSGVRRPPFPPLAHGVGNNEHSLTFVGCSEVAGAYAAPARVIPRAGQVREYAVEASAFPPEGGNVLQHE